MQPQNCPQDADITLMKDWGGCPRESARILCESETSDEIFSKLPQKDEVIEYQKGNCHISWSQRFMNLLQGKLSSYLYEFITRKFNVVLD